MSEPIDFETRLAAAVRRRAATAPTAVDAYAVAHTVAVAAASRPSAVGHLLPRWGTARMAVAAGLAVLLGGAALIIGSQLMSPAPRLGRLVVTGQLTTERTGQTATRLQDGRVLLVGGDDPPTGELYDPATGTFERTGKLSEAQRFGMAAAPLAGDRVLVVGGWDMTVGDDVTKWPLTFGEVYDPATGTFSRTADMAQARGYLWTALTLPDGRVLIAGGEVPDAPAGATESSSNRQLGSVELYDPASGAYLPGGSLLVPRSANTLSMLPDGRVLVAGGWTADGPTARAEIYDPATGTSTATGSMTTARAYHAAVTLADGRIVVVGGSGSGSGDPTVGTVEIFDPASDTFRVAGRLVSERSNVSAVGLDDGRVLVAGGTNQDGSPQTVEVFDPASGKSEVVGRLAAAPDPGASGSVTATLLLDGSVLVAGGSGVKAEQFDPTLTAEVARPRPDPVEPVGFVALGGQGALRTNSTATRLADGRVLIAGGTEAGTGPALASAEIFDPTTGSTSGTGWMSVPRSGHVATLLGDGRVLVVGGLSGADDKASWPSAEIYDPKAGTFSPAGMMTVARTSARISHVARTIEGSPSAISLPDGRAIIVGWQPDNIGLPQRAVQLYDPATGSLTAVDLPSGVLSRGPQGATLLPNGRVLVLDGNEDVLQAEVYDPVANTWELGASTTGRQAFSMTVADGVVLLAGGKVGSHSSNDESLATVETWDPISGTFSAVGDMLEARAGHTATLLPDGRVLVTGGIDHRHQGDGSALANKGAVPELWDPASDTFSPAGTMAAQRSGHTATLLADGRVLLVGGVTRSPDRDEPVPPFAELYVGP